MVIRDPAVIAALCGHVPPRAGCHLCALASRAAYVPCGKPDCGCGCSDADHAAAPAPDPYGYGDPPFVPSPLGSMPFWIPVAPPAISPTRDRLVLTVAVGEAGEEMHALTGPSQRRYAQQCGADYAVIAGVTQDPRMPCAEKWRVKDYVPHYPGGTLYLDADVFVRRTAPNLYAAGRPGEIGMRDISDQDGLIAWASPKYRELCATQGVEPLSVAESRYWNSGVWLGRPAHAGYWEPPRRPYPADHCTEEYWCRHNAAANGYEVRDLGEAFNWLWYQDRECRKVTATSPHFLHLAGMSQPISEWTMTNAKWRTAVLRLLAALAGDAE